MSDIQAAPGGVETAAPVAQPAPAVTPARDGALSVAEAARLLSAQRRKDNPADPSSAPQPGAAPEAATELPDEGNAAPPETEAPGEPTEGQPDPADTPPIEPPRSWTSEEKERFKSLPRELQAYLSEREQERDRDLRRRQNEAADERKAIAAEREAAQKVRQEYEGRLPALLQTLQQSMAGEFSDIKSHDDLQRMAVEDPPRYLKWQAQRDRIAAVAEEAQLVQARQVQEIQNQWAEFAQKQDDLFADKVPEIRDPAKAKVLRESAVQVLRDHGFTDPELTAAWNGQSGVSLRDARLQTLIRDAVRWRDAQKAKAAATAQPKPAPQRPGTSQPRPSAEDAEIQALRAKAHQTGNLRDMAALHAAEKRAAAKRK